MNHTLQLVGPVLVTLMLAVGGFAWAQDNAAALDNEVLSHAPRASDTQPQPAATSDNDLLKAADQLTHVFNMHREDNKVYDILIVSALALLSLFMVLRFLTAKSGYSAQHLVNATGLICIIFGTILLVLMAQSDQQMTAAIGILGAVAGYLFRSMQPRGLNGDEKAKDHY